VWLAVACLVDFWPLVEVARFGTHVGLEATVPLESWATGGITGALPTLCVYEEASLNRLAKG
jgi:hypothetical protein